MGNKPLKTIDGKFLYYAFVAGGSKIIDNQAAINSINVFPVSDKDTGTNLASTIRAVIDNTMPEKSFKVTITNIAEAALIGARGNSGVIFAQFLYGLSCETSNKHTVTLAEFAGSLKRSVPYIYEAITTPVEGTILTVIKDWAEFIFSKRHIVHDFRKVIIDSFVVIEKSLKATTSKLSVLNNNGFVDAGAKGFVLFVEGIINFIKKKRLKPLPGELPGVLTTIHHETEEQENKYRFCTEAIIKDLKTGKGKLRDLLEKDNDSVVIAGANKTCRIHVHTNNPAELFFKIKDYGTISYQKVDDMIRQQNISQKRKWNIALVTDSTCDLSQELIDFYQVNIVPLSMNFGENHYLDKVTILPDQFYSLLDTSDDFPRTSQINERTFVNLYSNLATYYDAIIAIHLTGKFSGTLSNSKAAAKKIEKEFGKPIHVIDSRNLSGALGLLVLKAAQNIEKGMAFNEIVKDLNEKVCQAKIYVSVKTLKYMIRGGRVSKPKGIIAGALGLNPIVSMDEDGNSLLFGKAFGQKAGLKKILEHIRKISKEKKVWNYIILHAHNKPEAENVENGITEMLKKEPVSTVDISPVIGMHAGIGAVAVSLLLE